MANRLPQELVEEIILLNDDHINQDWMENNIPPPRRLTLQTLPIAYIPRRPKACANVARQVCWRWHRFVNNSPRLWLRQLRIRSRSQHGFYISGRVLDAFNQAMQPDQIGSNCDIDLQINDSFLETAGERPSLADLMELLRQTAPYWRSFDVEYSRAIFLTQLDRFLNSLSVSPRLQFLRIRNLGAGLPTHDIASTFGHAYRAPSLKWAHVEGSGIHLPSFSHLSFLRKITFTNPSIPSDMAIHEFIAFWATSFHALQSFAFRGSKRGEIPMTLSFTRALTYSGTEPSLDVLEIFGSRELMLPILELLPVAQLTSLTLQDETVDRMMGEDFRSKSFSQRFGTKCLVNLSLLGNAAWVQRFLETLDVSSITTLRVTSKPSRGFLGHLPLNFNPNQEFPRLLHLILGHSVHDSFGGLGSGLGEILAPNLQSVAISDLVSASDLPTYHDATNGDQTRPPRSFPSLRQITLRGRARTLCRMSLMILMDLDLPALYDLYFQYSRFSLGVEGTDAELLTHTELFHDKLSRSIKHLKKLEVVAPATAENFSAFIAPLINLSSLRVHFKESSSLSIQWYDRDGNILVPSLRRLEISMDRKPDIREKVLFDNLLRRVRKKERAGAPLQLIKFWNVSNKDGVLLRFAAELPANTLLLAMHGLPGDEFGDR